MEREFHNLAVDLDILVTSWGGDRKIDELLSVFDHFLGLALKG